MYSVESSQAKNNVVIKIKGIVDVNEVKRVDVEVNNAIFRLKPGFALIADVSEFVPAAEEVRLELEKMMKNAKKLCVGHSYYIASDESAVAANQWQRTTRAAGVVSERVSSLDDLEQHLQTA